MYQKEYSTRNAAERATGLMYKQKADSLERILNLVEKQINAFETLTNVNPNPLSSVVISNIKTYLSQREIEEEEDGNNYLMDSSTMESCENNYETEEQNNDDDNNNNNIEHQEEEEEGEQQQQEQEIDDHISSFQEEENESYMENDTGRSSPDITNPPPRSAVSLVRQQPASSASSSSKAPVPNTKKTDNTAIATKTIAKKKAKRRGPLWNKKKQQQQQKRKKKAEYDCKVCDIKFGSDERAWREHNTIHDEEYSHKRYQCSLCPFRSYYKQNVIVHIQGYHHANELFKCPFKGCEFISTEDTLLKTHVRKEHLTTSILDDVKRKLFPCPMCEYKSNNKSNLSRHIQRIHVKKQLQTEQMMKTEEHEGVIEEHDDMNENENNDNDVLDMEQQDTETTTTTTQEEEEEDDGLEIPSASSSPLLIPQNFCQAEIGDHSDDEGQDERVDINDERRDINDERVDINDDCDQQ